MSEPSGRGKSTLSIRAELDGRKAIVKGPRDDQLRLVPAKNGAMDLTDGIDRDHQSPHT
ncbi:hypothetical protein [Aliiroseovarius pelagivivens]|uniref:hypothetical protein n=1 Tax=Aliiroseovarius pelagivivens TaxID=1639690 RepID=UPI0015E817AB|nr:hypothetical protein [Aliiroseovarius pelagivivens]